MCGCVCVFGVVIVMCVVLCDLRYVCVLRIVGVCVCVVGLSAFLLKKLTRNKYLVKLFCNTV